MSIILDLLKPLVAGVVAFFLLPIAGAALPWRHAQKISRQYLDLVVSLLGNACLLIRSGAGASLKQMSWDSDHQQWAIAVGGSKKHIEKDEHVGTLSGRPFGVVHERKPVFVTPRLMYVGQRVNELRAESKAKIEKASGDVLYRAFVRVPRNYLPVVDPYGSNRLIQSSADLNLTDRIITWVEKGQAGYNSRTVVDWMINLGFLAAGAGLVFFLLKLKSQTASAGGAIPF